MQKKLIALAIAGLASTAAFAQTNVTMYGIVDMGVIKTDADGKSDGWKIDNGLSAGSRIGFKGEENLGGGLKAVFTLEYMIQPDANAAIGATSDTTGTLTRQAYVGLAGNWGTVYGGRLQGVGFKFACSHNPVAGGAFDTISKLNGGALTLGCGSLGRWSNAVGYMSPNWNGFTFEVNHGRMTENATRTAGITSNIDDSYVNGILAAYKNGPFAASIAWSGVEGGSIAGVSAADTKEWGVGADYDFGMAKIYATYQDRDTDTAPGVKSLTNGDKWAVGLSVPVFKVGSIALSYADFDSDRNNGDADAWSLMYSHNLSKRTTLYVGYSDVSNDSANVSTTIGVTGAPITGGDSDMIAFGVRHSF